MSKVKGAFQMAAKLMAACALFQITMPLVLGFHATAYQMVALGLLGFGTSFGLYQGWRWLAYLAYIPVMAVTILALARSFDVTGLAVGWYYMIAFFDALTLLVLFTVLWQNPKKT